VGNQCIDGVKIYKDIPLKQEINTIDGEMVQQIHMVKHGYIVVCLFHFVTTFHHHLHLHQGLGIFQLVFLPQHFQRCIHFRKSYMDKTIFTEGIFILMVCWGNLCSKKPILFGEVDKNRCSRKLQTNYIEYIFCNTTCSIYTYTFKPFAEIYIGTTPTFCKLFCT